ncbi:MAG: hypothetical protein J5510_07775 [Prevotella sp.]|nr:hypothetical protein [Prevotella sp.]
MRKTKIDNPRYPHMIRIIRRKDASNSINPFERIEAGEEEIVIYCGPGRAYTDTTTDGDMNVDSNKRKCSIPVRFDKWPGYLEDETSDESVPDEVTEEETEEETQQENENQEESSVTPQPTPTIEVKTPLWPMDGDTIETVKGNVVEFGRVKDFEPDNNRSIVYWEFVRN